MPNQGEHAEACFLHVATARGFRLSRPFAPSAPYDFVLDTGAALLRIQVKSAAQPAAARREAQKEAPKRALVEKGARDSGIFHLAVTRGGGCRKRPYRRDEIDFLAAYLIPLRLWYIIPVSALRGVRTINLCPGSRRRFEPFRNAWHLLHLEDLSSRARARKRSAREPRDLLSLRSGAKAQLL